MNKIVWASILPMGLSSLMLVFIPTEKVFCWNVGTCCFTDTKSCRNTFVCLFFFPGARLGAAGTGRPLGCCDAVGNYFLEQIRRSKECSLLSSRPASGAGKLTADWQSMDEMWHVNRLSFHSFLPPVLGCHIYLRLSEHFTVKIRLRKNR